MASLIRRKRAKKTEVEFALDLGDAAVVLYERGAVSGWKKFASAELDDPEFSVVIGLLRNEAETYSGSRDPVRIWLPSSQVLKRRTQISGQTEAERLRAAYEYIRLQTSYRIEDVAIAVAPEPRGGKTTILITFAETWREARAYAQRWGFVPGDVSTRCFAADFGAEGPVFLLEGYEEEESAPISRARLHLTAATVALAVTGAAAWTLQPQLSGLAASMTGEDGLLAWITAEAGGESSDMQAADAAPSATEAQTGGNQTTFTVATPQVQTAPDDPEPADTATATTAVNQAQESTEQPAQDQSLSLAASGGAEPQQAPRFDLAAPTHVPTVPTLDPKTAPASAPEIGRGPAKLATLAAPAGLGKQRDSGSLPTRPPSPVVPDRASANGSAWTDIPGLKNPDDALPQLASLDLAKDGSDEILHSTDLDLLGTAGAVGKPPLPVPRSLPSDVRTDAPAAPVASGEDLTPEIAAEISAKLDGVLSVSEPPLELASVAPLAVGQVNHPDITPSAVPAAPLPLPKPTADLVEPALAPAPAVLSIQLPPVDADVILAQAPDTVPVLPAPKPPVAPGPEAPLSQLPEQQPDPNDMTPTALAVQEAPPPPLKPRSAKAVVVETAATEAAADTPADVPDGAETSDADTLAGVTSRGDELTDEESLAPTDLAVEAAPLPPLKPWEATPNEPRIAGAPEPVADFAAPADAGETLQVATDQAPSPDAPGAPGVPEADTAGAFAIAGPPPVEPATAEAESTGPTDAENAAEDLAAAPESAPGAETGTAMETETGAEVAAQTPQDAEATEDYPVTVIPDLAKAMAELRVPAPRPDGIFRSADGSIRSLAQIPPRARPAWLSRERPSEAPSPEPAETIALAQPATPADPAAEAPADRSGSGVPVTITGTDPLQGLLPDQATPETEEDPDAPTEYASLSAPLPRKRPALPALPKTLPSISLPKISPKSVQEAATEQGLPLDQVTLIGILDLESGRRALLRLPNGRYRSVVVGDVLDGWRISLIGLDALRVTRSGQDRTLLLVSR